mmetsp:Transcript_7988/g.23588  ORF Transcript_7988/g.23588 Transcript_7988/m.23588 type:complete len:318 (-) Transcript_7988:178-1131(-)
MGRKRDLSIFDAIEELDTQDRKAERKRRKETTAEKKRAGEVQSQSKIYNHLLESRILLQRAINKVNDGSYGSDNDNDSSSFRDGCNALIQKLLETRNQLSGISALPESDDDDDDDEKEYDCRDLLRPAASASTDLHDALQTEYEKHREEWKQILNRKHKNLRLHSGVTAKSQFRIMDSSFWEQVEATVEYEELRNNNNDNNEEQSSTPSGSVEFFDDSKVYQQLLKDFVANSTSENGARSGEPSSNALRSSNNYNNNNNSKKKKNVDRKASKGRKIRYKEISKLVNFTFPLSRPNTSNLDTDEYFQSLFGGAGVSGR